jgi:hypothetical protein
MKHIKTFESFLNEANLSKEFMRFNPGDVVLVTSSFKPTALNYKDSAKTWWGQKISSLKNMWAKDTLKYNPDRVYKTGDPLFVFTKPSTIDSEGLAHIYGYAGFFFGDFAANRDPNDFALSERDLEWDYNDMMTQTIILAIMEGYAEVGKYSDIDAKARNEFETEIKKARITSPLIKDIPVLYDGMQIHKWERTNQGYIFSGFDPKTGNEVPKRLVKFADIANGKFTVNGKEITGDPFKS